MSVWVHPWNHCSTLVGVLVGGEAEWGRGCMGTLYFLLNFFCEPKPSLRNRLFIFNHLGKDFKNKLILQIGQGKMHNLMTKDHMNDHTHAAGPEAQRSPHVPGPFLDLLGCVCSGPGLFYLFLALAF